ncbi:MAG: discoidin domain-containing protein, partial [Methylococcales bacterium]|nr:discoidin domain-containing protein [Methylococcales bacterium]
SLSVPVGLSGRYVRIQGADNGPIMLAEVQVFEWINLALDGTATQVSTGFGGVATNAIDGNTDGLFGNGSVTHTNTNLQDWWQVDLGAKKPIGNIVVWNRTDAGQTGIDDSYILVSDTPFSSDNIVTSRAEAKFEFHITAANRPNPSISVPVDLVGRYVRIQGADNGPITLAEVQVFEGEHDLVDLITNLSSDVQVVEPADAVAFTVTVENHGPKAAVNVDWQVIVRSAESITNVLCSADEGATCPASFPVTIGTETGSLEIASVIPSIPTNGKVTLTFDTITIGDSVVATNYKIESLVVASSQADSHLETNDADINVSAIALRRSYGVVKTILRYEDSSGTTIASPVSGGKIVYQLVVTNDGINSVTNLQLQERYGVEVGTGTVVTDSRGDTDKLPGYEQSFYAIGTFLESINCTAATNGAVCPADETYTDENLPGDFSRAPEIVSIPFMPGRTTGAQANPGAYPASTLTFEASLQVGAIACSTTAGTNRQIVNQAQTLTTGNAESLLAAPYGPGDSSDNI